MAKIEKLGPGEDKESLRAEVQTMKKKYSTMKPLNEQSVVDAHYAPSNIEGEMQHANVSIIGGDFNLDAKIREENELTKTIVKTHWKPKKNGNMSLLISEGQATCCADQKDKKEPDFGKQYDRIAIVREQQTRLKSMSTYAFAMEGQGNGYKKAGYPLRCKQIQNLDKVCMDAQKNTDISTGCKVLCAFKNNTNTELNTFTPNDQMQGSAEHLPIVTTFVFGRTMMRRAL